MNEIQRKDGIVYKRKSKVKNYDCSITIKISKELRDKFKERCSKEHISYNKIVRNLIEQYMQNS